MIHVDPASPAFERLPRYQQARVYASMNWTLDAIADEMGILVQTVERLINPKAHEKDLARKRAWNKTPKGKASKEANRVRRRAAERALRGPAKRAPNKLTKEQVRLILSAASNESELAQRFGVTPQAIRYHRKRAAA